MTYFYKVAGTIARKVGGEPPAVLEYVAIDPKGMMRHIKNDIVVEEMPLEFPEDESNYSASELRELKELYNSTAGITMAKQMLFSKYRKKKTTKPKPIRKVKVVKKCKCK